jgi:hypothetical protein
MTTKLAVLVLLLSAFGSASVAQRTQEESTIPTAGPSTPETQGGPLFTSKDNKVIGVVVAKYHLYPPQVKNAIIALSNSKSGFMYSATDEHGNTIQVTEGQVVAMVLEQFWNTTQVMIGEAISLSGLKAFIASKETELR